MTEKQSSNGRWPVHCVVLAVVILLGGPATLLMVLMWHLGRPFVDPNMTPFIAFGWALVPIYLAYLEYRERGASAAEAARSDEQEVSREQ